MRPRKISGKNGHEIQLFFLLFFGNKTFRFGSFYNLHFSFPFSNTVCFVLFLVRRIKERGFSLLFKLFVGNTSVTSNFK